MWALSVPQGRERGQGVTLPALLIVLETPALYPAKEGVLRGAEQPAAQPHSPRTNG